MVLRDRRVGRSALLSGESAEVAAELLDWLQTLGVCGLKIQRSADSSVVFTLSGRIEAEDVKELRQPLALEKAGQQAVLDLGDVTLVNEGAVKFLAGCDADNIKLKNSPAYVREWIERVKLEPVADELDERI